MRESKYSIVTIKGNELYNVIVTFFKNESGNRSVPNYKNDLLKKKEVISFRIAVHLLIDFNKFSHCSA